jgi:hypothetical protein
VGTTFELLDEVGTLLGQKVTLERHLGRKGRAIVARLRLDDGETVVVKGPSRPIAEGGASSGAWSPVDRFRNEVAALRTLGGAGGIVPRLLAADPEHMWMVLEDLGETRSLANALLSRDPVAAMKAISAWASALGQLHRASADPVTMSRWESERTALGGLPPQESAVLALASARPQLDLLVNNVRDAESAAVEIDLRLSDRRWWAMTPRDACPDNCALQEDGSAVLFDFEGGGTRHSLLDAAYLVTTFPTCWCTGDLPVEARTAGLDAYQAAAVWPFDDFDRHLAAAAAFHGLWVLSSSRFADALGDTGGQGWRWEEVGFDVPAPRRIVALALDDLDRAVAGDDALKALGDLARSLRTVLTERWGTWELPPPHPAFVLPNQS